MDLSDANAQKLILQWVCDPRCVWVHMGVPCGTASRASDIKMSKTQHGPPPLRSFEFPDGLPASQLSPSNLARLRAPNRLYRFMKEIILLLPSTTRTHGGVGCGALRTSRPSKRSCRCFSLGLICACVVANV